MLDNELHQTIPIHLRSQSDPARQREPDQREFRKEFISQYSNRISIDTSYFIDNTQKRVILTHHCNFDNAITVPGKYYFDDHKEFVTHNFTSRVTILSGGDTIVSNQITKATFEGILYPELKSYAVLSFNSLKIKNDTVQIRYSISIPATDVGIGVSVNIDRNGNSTIPP
jgi:Domain of unknown function (DUF4738)